MEYFGLIVIGVAALAALGSILTLTLLRSRPTLDTIRLAVTEISRAEADRIKVDLERRHETSRESMSTALFAFQESLTTQIRDFGIRLDSGMKAVDDKTGSAGKKLDEDIKKMGEDAQRNRDGLRVTIEAKLDGAANKQAVSMKEFREEVTGSFQQLLTRVVEALGSQANLQREKLETVASSIAALTEKNEKAQEALRQAVEHKLEILRTDNAGKLDEMRKTVDERLQSTLESRLGESFGRVVEHLERVHKGIGEMQTLASNVGDLRKILTNVRSRGTFGEVQLETLLAQFLSPEQYIRNAQTKENTQERVEFAIKFPGRDGTGEFLLPVDAKFPQEDYERLLAAAEIGDAEALSEAAKALENRIKASAKTIREKYLNPPQTSDFGILFLPTEGLYAEVLRRPGLLESIQREYHVTLTGPTTFTAYLIALQMGFRTLAIEKRSGEVWAILGAIRGEFGRYNQAVEKLARQLNSASTSVENLGRRARVMSRKLRDVETLPEQDASTLLGLLPEEADSDLEETEEAPEHQEAIQNG